MSESKHDRTAMKCPLKPGISCSRAPELVESTPCPSCPAERASGRPSRQPVRATLIGVIRSSDLMGVR